MLAAHPLASWSTSGMMESATIAAVLLIAVSITAISFAVGGGRDALPYMLAYFVFFSFGPVVNYLTGGEIYHGTVTALIAKASVGLLLAVLGMGLVSFAIRTPSYQIRGIALQARQRNYLGAVIALWLLTTYAAVVLVARGPALLAGDKLSRIAAAGPLHATFLTVQLCVCCLYFVASRTPRGKVAYWSNMTLYIAYCLATQERDFLFVLFSLMLHVQIFRVKPMGGKLFTAGAASALAATVLLNFRSGDGIGAAQVLNQGSVLFVDTYVMHLIPAGEAHLYGKSYVDAFSSLLPNRLLSDPESLTNWLANHYAPGAPGGYGFSLTAEAYMNFGIIGIPVVFLIMSCFQRLLVLRIDRGYLWSYLSMLYLIVWMYTVRGESVVVIRMLAYGLVLFGLVHVTSLFSDRRGSFVGSPHARSSPHLRC
jgi:hypothetical protein